MTVGEQGSQAPPSAGDGTAAGAATDTSSAPATARRREYGLDLLRIAAMLGVVGIHTFGAVVSRKDLNGTAAWWVATAIDLGACWAVPVFIMISGALTLDPRQHARGTAQFYRKRAARILPALVFWHVVYLVLREVSVGDLTPKLAGQLVFDARVYPHLYFLWLILGLYLVAPVLAAYLEAGDRRRAQVFAAVAVTCTIGYVVASNLTIVFGFPRRLVLNAFTMWMPYTAMFLVGWALHEVRLSRRKAWLTGAGTLVVLAEIIWQWPHKNDRRLIDVFFPTSYFGPLILAATVGVFLIGLTAGASLRLTPGRARWLRRLSDATFGVFLVHFLVVYVLRQLFIAPAKVELWSAFLLFLGTCVVSWSISMIAARIPVVRAVF